MAKLFYTPKQLKKMPRWKRVLIQRRMIFMGVCALLVLIILITIICVAVSSHKKKAVEPETQSQTVVIETQAPEPEPVEPTMGIGLTEPDAQGFYTVGDAKFLAGYTATATSSTLTPSSADVQCEHIVVINEKTNEIVAQKNAKERICPASMTKVLTILVAAEHLTEEDLDATIPITIQMTDYAYFNDCSALGYLDGDVATVRDLFYGTILPSGADAAIALATYVSGSEDAFVELMNQKLDELGLSETTHFTNVAGIYSEDHYSTVYDIAMIMKAAEQNDFCREVLYEHRYTTAPTREHDEGITVSNWFLRNIDDMDADGEVMGAKTGYVNESRYCAVSYAIGNDGNPYICATVGSPKKYQAIKDHATLYREYTP